MTMPPRSYNKTTSFTDYATDNPSGPLPGTQIDVELANIENAVDDTQAALALIQRSDGALKNGIVTTDSLSASLVSDLTADIEAAVGATADAALAAANAAQADADTALAHVNASNNPHNVTASQVGNTVAQWNASHVQGVEFMSGTPAQGYMWAYDAVLGKMTLASPASLIGPQGPQGDTGPQGPQGIQGPEGPMGPGTGDMLAANNLSDLADLDASRLTLGASPLCGFPVDSSGAYYVTMAYNETTRTVTITPTGATFDVYVDGARYTFTGAQSVTHAATQGGHFIYVNNSGALVASTTPWDLAQTAPAMYVFWDATNSQGLPFYEWHHAGRDVWAHRRIHSVDGTQIVSGFTASGYTLSTDSDAAVTYSVTSGVIADEDIQLTTEALPDGGPYTIFERSGASGDWVFSKTNTLPFLHSGGVLQYNQLTGGTWQRANVANTYFVNYYVFATTALPVASITPSPSGSQNIVVVPGQATHATSTAAQAEVVSSLSWGNLPFQEIAPLYQVTLEYKTSYSGTAKTRIVSVTRIIGSRVSITATAVAGALLAANNLSDLASAATARTNLGLATVAATGAYSDLSGTPTLGTAAALDVGTTANKIVQLDGTAKLPAVDGSQLTNLPAAGGWTEVTSQTASGATYVTFTSGLTSAYKLYAFVFEHLSVDSTTNGWDDLRMQWSADGGSTWTVSLSRAGGTDQDGTWYIAHQNRRTTDLIICDAGTNMTDEDANAGWSGTLFMYVPAATSGHKKATWNIVNDSTSDTNHAASFNTGGCSAEAIGSAINGVRFFTNTLSPMTGTVRLLGVY